MSTESNGHDKPRRRVPLGSADNTGGSSDEDQVPFGVFFVPTGQGGGGSQPPSPLMRWACVAIIMAPAAVVLTVGAVTVFRWLFGG